MATTGTKQTELLPDLHVLQKQIRFVLEIVRVFTSERGFYDNYDQEIFYQHFSCCMHFLL